MKLPMKGNQTHVLPEGRQIFRAMIADLTSPHLSIRIYSHLGAIYGQD